MLLQKISRAEMEDYCAYLRGPFKDLGRQGFCAQEAGCHGCMAAALLASGTYVLRGRRFSSFP